MVPMRILVTGGAGYVGTALIPLLTGRGHAVRCMDLRDPCIAAAAADVEVQIGDVRDPAAVAAALQGAEAVIHLAAIVGYPACDAAPDEAWSVNVDGTRTIADAIPAGVPFVSFSTCSVYGRSPSRHCHEDDPVVPLSRYARSKHIAEASVRGRGGVVLRPATVYGPSPRFREDLIVHDFIGRGLRGEHLTLFEPEAIRAFIHIEDVGRAALFGIERFAVMTGAVYNIGSRDGTVTKAELAALVAESTGLTFDVELGQEDPDGRDYWIDTGRIAALGFEPRRPFRAGIAETSAWMRERCSGAQRG